MVAVNTLYLVTWHDILVCTLKHGKDTACAFQRNAKIQKEYHKTECSGKAIVVYNVLFKPA